jgi:hypothetical protein
MGLRLQLMVGGWHVKTACNMSIIVVNYTRHTLKNYTRRILK